MATFELQNDGLPDTLVLKIEEHYSGSVDTSMYVVYDHILECYVVRGKRRDTSKIISETYSFECGTEHQLASFIQFVLDSYGTVSYILYNYKNLPSTSDDITFEFLAEESKLCREVTGYDNLSLKRKELLRNLRILKNVFNYNH